MTELEGNMLKISIQFAILYQGTNKEFYDVFMVSLSNLCFFISLN